MLLLGLVKQHPQTSFSVRLFKAGEKTGRETRDKAAVHIVQFARRKRTGQHHTPSTLLQFLDRRKELNLDFLRPLQKMHVLKQQDVRFMKTPFELTEVALLGRLHKTVGKALRSQILHPRIITVAAFA